MTPDSLGETNLLIVAVSRALDAVAAGDRTGWGEVYAAAVQASRAAVAAAGERWDHVALRLLHVESDLNALRYLAGRTARVTLARLLDECLEIQGVLAGLRDQKPVQGEAPRTPGTVPSTGQVSMATATYRPGCGCPAEVEVKRSEVMPKCPVCGKHVVAWLFVRSPWIDPAETRKPHVRGRTERDEPSGGERAEGTA